MYFLRRIGMAISWNNFSLFHSRKLLLPGILILLGSAFLSGCGSSKGNATNNSGTSTPVGFALDVAPILNNHCVMCHGGSQASASLDLTSYAGIMAGGRSGAVILPGNSGESRLISLVKSGQMPRSGAKLTPDQIQILVDWIDAGALDN
jgi:hypothetical protein